MSLSVFVTTDVKWRDALDTPAVVVDLDVVERNLQRGAEFASANGLAFRPHIKTHKIPALAMAQLEYGAVGITAQKITEAVVMADSGITDILVSFNIVGDIKLRRLARLHARTTVRTVADSPEVVEGLARHFTDRERKLGVLVEIDGFMNRCGAVSVEAAMAIVRTILGAKGLRFDGFMIYPAPDRWEDGLEFLSNCTAECARLSIPVDVASTGGTPDMSQVLANGRATEYRAGSYIYNDRFLLERGVVAEKDCALSVLATVVSRPEHGRAVIDAGSKVLSSDLLGLEGFGAVKGAPDVSIPIISEEHGHLTSPVPITWDVGQRIEIIPNHCCVVSNLVDEVTFVRGNFLVSNQVVAARGTVQ